MLTIHKNLNLKSVLLSKNSKSPIGSLTAENIDMKVLIVDDNIANIFVIKSLLKKLNVPFDTAGNGKEAIEKVMEKGKTGNFTLILMDINMPVMNGIEATVLLNQHMRDQEIPSIPIVALSAQGDESIINSAMNAGMKEYVEKPISRDKLEHLVRKYEWLKD
jgi:CheY-like chemotaxis protein